MDSFDGGAAGAGGSGGAAGAKAETARQALLLATQALGVNAAAVRVARDGLGVLFDMLLDYANSCGKVFTADDILLLGVRSNEVVRLALERGAPGFRELRHPDPTESFAYVKIFTA